MALLRSAAPARGAPVEAALAAKNVEPQINEPERNGDSQPSAARTSGAQAKGHTRKSAERRAKDRHPAQQASLLATMPLRQVQVQGNAPICRTHDIKIITTLRDPSAHHALQIAAWYQRRWQVKLYFDDIKTSLRMDALRCKIPHTIAGELLMHMVAYIFVRHPIISAEPMREL